MTEPLAPQFDPHTIEAPLYAWWTERQLYHVPADAPGDPYVIQMPPPNVTAALHAGHGLTYTIQDVLIRFERMRGRKALWVPGTDHGGIATQNVVERLLATQGQTRFDVGRDAFVDHVRTFVAETGGTILEQLKALGASCDWSRTYYTLDPALSRAVREAFVRLYDKGLIYRGKYIVNWCPRCLTTLSNEEVEKEERDAQIWQLRYPLAEGDGSIVVATTRPETMLGDTGIAVHPGDERYRSLIGRMVRLPLTDRLIPIVGDAAVDATFGTGAVKVTPAHDPLDFDIGARNNLATIDVLTPDARMNENVPERFRALDRLDARKRVIGELDQLGLLVQVEPHRHAVGHCYRCDTVVEPRLSDQWFVKMTPLAAPALAAYRDGRLRFIPEFQGDVYANWLENIRDWCISRQLWWGHRIPVWYCDACSTTIVSRQDPSRCASCHGPLRQDDDVLDTWFSSWLVPLSSLGWPEDTEDLRAFYPSSTMVTAPEILFLWVSRMIVAGLEFGGEVPFRTVYLHGTVRDTQHRKMSKSLGNGIDPTEVIARHGADALRYTVISGMSVGTDLMLDPADLDTSFAPGRHFANKLWNIGRFLLGNLEAGAAELDAIRRDTLALPDRWILSRLQDTIDASTRNYERFRLNDGAAAVYHFLWSDFADWYVEHIKPRLYGTQPGGDAARAVAAYVFDIALRLLHPVMPFITETLWQRLPNSADGASISVAPWPVPDVTLRDPAAVAELTALQELITAVRTRRAEYQIPPGEKVRTYVQASTPAFADLVLREQSTVSQLTGSVYVRLVDPAPEARPLSVAGVTYYPVPTPSASSILSNHSTVYTPLDGSGIKDRECQRLRAEAAKLAELVAAQERKLGNAQFVARAPALVVAKERDKLAGWRTQAAVLREKRQALECTD